MFVAFLGVFIASLVSLALRVVCGFIEFCRIPSVLLRVVAFLGYIVLFLGFCGAPSVSCWLVVFLGFYVVSLVSSYSQVKLLAKTQ